MRKLLFMISLSFILLIPFKVLALTPDEIYKTIAPEGKIYTNSIKFEKENDLMFLLEKVFYNDYGVGKYEDYYIYTQMDDDYVNGKLIIEEYNSSNKYTYDIEIVYEKVNEQIKSKVDKYVKLIPTEGQVEDRLFILDDLELINYMLAGGNSVENWDYSLVNAIINYSSEIQNLLEYGNLTAELTTRAGWGYESDPFSSGGFGNFFLSYNDKIYGYVDEAGVKSFNVIYIPDNTVDTNEAYIKAAQERIDEYVGKDVVSIKLAGSISSLDTRDWIIPLDKIVDITKTTGDYYTLEINGEEFSFLIAKDTKKMKQPKLFTKDITLDASIETDEPIVPLDAKIEVKKYDKDSNVYKKIQDKLNIFDLEVYDLNLYSNSQGVYIKKLNNGTFKVYVPIKEEYKNKKLNSYYIKDNGEIETHEVTIEGEYAVFYTNHFSTYAIGEKEIIKDVTNIEVPKTGDNIYTYFVLLGIGVYSLSMLLKRKNN